jgi:hypothetical protein
MIPGSTALLFASLLADALNYKGVGFFSNNNACSPFFSDGDEGEQSIKGTPVDGD